MKFIRLALVAGLFLGAAGSRGAEPLAGGQVTLPYAEFRGLLEIQQKTPAPAPPVAFAVLASRFALAPESASLRGSVAFEVQSFGDAPQLIPLLGDVAAIRKIAPDGATVVRKDGFYQLLATKPERQTVTLDVELPGRKQDGSATFRCAMAPAVISELDLGKLPEGEEAAVAGAARDGNRFHLGSRDALEVQIGRAQREPAGETVPMPPVVATATSEMRVVNDGTFFNATAWAIRHNASFVWKVRPGPETQVVSCLVDGRPVAPALAADGTLEIRVPEKSGQTLVALSYTGKAAAFQPVRGNFSVALPSTDLLVEQSDWRLVLPAAFVASAVEGNVEFLPGEARNELRLRKELCRGDAPSARIFYQKPETTKQP